MTFIYNFPINFNIPQVRFKSAPQVYKPQGSQNKDAFSTNPLYERVQNIPEIEASALSNPRISQMLGEKNLPVRVNKEELDKLQNGHHQNARITAAKIYSSLPEEMKQEVNLKQLQEAAMLHDYGKILIPDNVLNKKGALNDSEREIVQMHSELGYELLKDKGFDKRTLELIKYHHQTPYGDGYPAMNKEYKHGIDSQILNAADEYAALREKRSYKDPLSREDALNIIKQDVENGLISEEVYNALVKAV